MFFEFKEKTRVLVKGLCFYICICLCMVLVLLNSKDWSQIRGMKTATSLLSYMSRFYVVAGRNSDGAK